jgi:hypothetical protein
MHDWSEQEEKMRERFPRRNNSNLRRPNDNRNDKSQWDYSGPSRKCKPDDLIVAVDHPSRGKKSTTQEEFEKLLQKKCLWHPGANHAAIDCYHLRRTFSNPGGGKKNKKPVDKEPGPLMISTIQYILVNRPKTVAGLRDIMHDWSEQEEKMRERFPRCNDSNLRRPNDNRNDKSQRDYSGPSQKRKPDDLIVAVDRPSRGKKSTTQEEFEKLLQKKCPWHLGTNHAAIDCYHLRRTFSNPGGSKKKKKPVDKEPKDDDQGDQAHNAKFQDALKTINVIFGGDGDFGCRREQKLLLQEIMSVEPAVPRPLRWSEVPISFSRDDQWTSFSEPGKFPLVLDPVVAEVRLTKVLIDGGSGLNLIFASTLRKMGLDVTDLLVLTKSPFYGITPGNEAHPLGTVVLPVTFGTRENYRTEFIKFKVANFESSYHAILGRPALAKFMAVPHYIYLLLKMPSQSGVLTLPSDLKNLYDCNQEAI